MSDETIVEDRGITVTKAFDRDGFPVPAVTFRVESDRTDPVSIRIVDEIPAEFGIEQIGFHPEYGSEHWTATGDGVVRFERTVDSGEAFTTVYGVKMTEDERAEPFLDPPSLEVNPEEIEDSTIEDVVPKESSDVVRELAGGERASVPGLEEEPAQDRQEVSEEPSESSVTQTTTADDDAEILSEREEVEAETEEPADAEDVEADSPTTADSAEEETAIGDEILDAGSDVGTSTSNGETESVSRSESSEVPEDDRETEAVETSEEKGREKSASPDTAAAVGSDESSSDEPEKTEAEGEASEPPEEPASPETGASTSDTEPPMTEESTDPTSQEVATGEETTGESTAATVSGDESTDHEPTAPAESTEAVENLGAALAEEIRNGSIDEEDLAVIREAVGDTTTSEAVRLEHLQARVSDLEAYTDELESFLDENGRARTVLDGVETTVEALADDVADVDSRVNSAQGEREALRERVNSITEELSAIDDLEAKIERIGGDLDALEDRVADGEAARMEVEELESDLEDVVEDVEDVESDIEEFQEWRSQLSDLFT